MNQINCLIVDDEPMAQEIVKTYCGHLPLLHVVACCGNALEAKMVLQQQHIDILFLDINMPVLSGLAFLKTLNKPLQVILTTAYKEYAIDAFDLAACDYLLKPFSLERFLIAVDKALERLKPGGMMGTTSAVVPVAAGTASGTPSVAAPAGTTAAAAGGTPSIDSSSAVSPVNYLFVKTDGKIYKVLHDDLLFATANGNYTKVVTKQQALLPAITFSSFEEQLPKTQFLRVHRSFIINKSKISHIEGNIVYIDHHEIPIGSSYKEAFLKELGF